MSVFFLRSRPLIPVFFCLVQLSPAGGNVTVAYDTHTMFGEIPFVRGEPIPYFVIATSPLTVREFSRAFMDECGQREPSSTARIYEFVAYSMCDKLAAVWSAMTAGADVLSAIPYRSAVVAAIQEHDTSAAQMLLMVQAFARVKTVVSLSSLEQDKIKAQ